MPDSRWRYARFLPVSTGPCFAWPITMTGEKKLTSKCHGTNCSPLLVQKCEGLALALSMLFPSFGFVTFCYKCMQFTFWVKGHGHVAVECASFFLDWTGKTSHGLQSLLYLATKS